jgi:hypothetical protein
MQSFPRGAFRAQFKSAPAESFETLLAHVVLIAPGGPLRDYIPPRFRRAGDGIIARLRAGAPVNAESLLALLCAATRAQVEALAAGRA